MDDDLWIGPHAQPDTYKLIENIGGGGEGDVWKAEVPLSGSSRDEVAIKIVPIPGPEDLGPDWPHHARLLKSLEHDGIIRVRDAFLGPHMHRAGGLATTEGDFDTSTEPPAEYGGIFQYVVMSFAHGPRLNDWISDHPETPLTKRLQILTNVASALDYMHTGNRLRQPVAHGDVKPSNVIVREAGGTVLVDLGLTRLVDGPGKFGKSRPYAAPELFTPGAACTPEADRFAFAATVVHLILGETPPVTRRGDRLDVRAVEKSLRRSPLTTRHPALIGALLDLLRAAPGTRPQSLQHWLSTLANSMTTRPAGRGRGALPDRPPTGEPPGRSGPKALLVGGLALALVAAAASLYVTLKPTSHDTPPGTNGSERTQRPSASPLEASGSASPGPTAEPSGRVERFTLKESNTPFTSDKDKIDFDTGEPGHGPQLDGPWNPRRSGRLADIILEPERVHSPDDAHRMLPVGSVSPSSAGCQEELAEPGASFVGSINSDTLRPQEVICLKTDEDRIVTITILEISTSYPATLVIRADGVGSR